MLDGMKQRLRLQRRATDYRLTFGGVQGRRVLSNLIKRNYVLTTSMIVGDPHMTAFNEGRRAAVLDILRELRWDDSDIERLTQERDEDD